MLNTDVLVIGSSAAGLVAATTGKRVYNNKKITVVTMMPKTLIPCGIPYVFGSVEKTDNNILPAEKTFESSGIDTIHDEVISINRKDKKVELKKGETIMYKKLVIATGSVPKTSVWLKGFDLQNVFTIKKDKHYIDEIQSKLMRFKRIVTIGAGFIGVEISDELNKIGKDVTLIEQLPNILSLAFDKDLSAIAEEKLINRGVKVRTGESVKEIIGTDRVEGVLLQNGEFIEAEAIILSLGYMPSSQLASNAGLPTTNNGFIEVDEYMRTIDKDVFAIGDCAEKKNFVTRKSTPVMLASTACAEARIAGMNLFKLSAIKTFSGTISIFATAIGDTGFGVAGLTESEAVNEGFDIVTGVFEGIDRHPGTLKDAHKQTVKLVVGREAGVILGGEVMGGLSIGELVNTIGIIIENRMTINSLLTMQIGTHPLLTASPAGYPLIKAAENASSKIMFIHSN